jgi:hypothetical protein
MGIYMKNLLRQETDSFIPFIWNLISSSGRISMVHIILAVFLIQSCKKSDDNDVQNSGLSIREVQVDLVVLTADEQGADLSGVKLGGGDVTGVTNQYGSFIFENVNVSSLRYFVSAEKSCYFSTGYGGQRKSILNFPLILNCPDFGGTYM